MKVIFTLTFEKKGCNITIFALPFPNSKKKRKKEKVEWSGEKRLFSLTFSW